MAVKIVTPGKEPQQNKYEVRCHRCGCVFHCEDEDFYEENNGVWPGFGRETWKETRCPTCQKGLRKDANAKLIMSRPIN